MAQRRNTRRSTSRKKTHPPAHKRHPLLMLFLCFLLGAGLYVGWQKLRDRLPTNFATARPVGELTPDALASMSREQLEAEILRLQRELDAREKENADLMIQLRLAEEGIPGGL